MQSSKIFFAAMTLMKLFTFRGFGTSKKSVNNSNDSLRSVSFVFNKICPENEFFYGFFVNNVTEVSPFSFSKPPMPSIFSMPRS